MKNRIYSIILIQENGTIISKISSLKMNIKINLLKSVFSTYWFISYKTVFIKDILIYHPDLNNKMLFPVDSISNKVRT